MPLLEPASPTQEDRKLAAQAIQSLASGEIHYAQLPADVIRMLEVVLSEMADGRTASIKPSKTELSTFEAARYLGVSRPYVIKLLNEGKMKYRLVGAHRRIPIDEVEAYRKAQDEIAYAAMAELQAMAQE